MIEVIELKKCGRCQQPKPPEEFQRDARSKDGRHGWCGGCCNAAARASRHRNVTPGSKREANLAARYGLSGREFTSLLASQGGNCAICRTPPARPVVDHDHATGRVRGILCHGCNIKLPAVENAAYLTAAQAYLGRAPA